MKKFIEFDNWNNTTERERIYIDPLEVSCVHEYRDRRAYGGFNEVSEIKLKDGSKYVVHGHVAKKIADIANS